MIKLELSVEICSASSDTTILGAVVVVQKGHLEISDYWGY